VRGVSWEAIRVVAIREVRQRLRDRGFLLTTAFLLVAVALPGIFAGGSSGEAEQYAVGSLDDGSAALVEVAGQQDELFGAEVETRNVDDRDQAERLVEAGDLDVVVADGRDLIVEDGIDDGLRSLLESSNAVERAGGQDAPPEAERLQLAPLLSEGQADAAGLAALAAILLFALIYLTSYFVASGVVEEKASRVVEVILSSVQPRELLAGKVAGMGVLGVGQVVLVLALGLVVGAGTGFIAVSAETVALVIAVLGGFVLGFLLYGCLFAVAGAVVSRQEDLQYSVLVPTVGLFIAFFAVNSQAGEAGSGLARLLTLLPPTAPFMLPVRVGAGEAAAWEIVAGVLLTLVAIAALVAVAGRLYAGSVLRFGGRVSLGDAWRG
jgi:ABC-2 type transport system permease protein